MIVCNALPAEGGRLERYELRGEPIVAQAHRNTFNRVAFAAAHVVADPLTQSTPSAGSALDFEATLAFRRHLLDLGFGIAEAMDTSQRGMGLSWDDSRELIRHSLEAAGADERDRIFSGVGTDQLDPATRRVRSTTWSGPIWSSSRPCRAMAAGSS